ncbi:uncharacterized protein MONBRDRAFT_22425 [Monosiga brevicollis MX1]|uniref:Uncharacterized protein n=1 Tax=Monosiga brevicollis TaxID=81824 RepID=A9UQJ3_MONBE|nr:uncharacterized protein MONBRDRAFT_22425 [Monosiga brevicollis MX1]EDQ93055.1 predicted protein [Monosiga brevicollis MX1]|eukprot:XP_001742817.1 hypothetical protein [Monosiga brevicollis MX1]
MAAAGGSEVLPACPDSLITKARDTVIQLNHADTRFKKISTLLSNNDVSGNSERDYIPVKPVAPLELLNSLDPELVDQIQQAQAQSLTGIFPEVNRAWLTVDSHIYIWDFDDGSDLCVYRELQEVIVGVALVRPKPGVFDAKIQYLLALATPLTVYLVGVEFTGRPHPTMHGCQMNMDPDALHRASTDNVAMTALVGGPNGRIFMGGNDGCVYELLYERGDGWLFRRKCRKINHSQGYVKYFLPSVLSSVFADNTEQIDQLCFDPSRNVLYSRTRNFIQAFVLEEGGLRKAQTLYAGQDRLDAYIKLSDRLNLGALYSCMYWWHSPHDITTPCVLVNTNHPHDAVDCPLYPQHNHGQIIYITPVHAEDSNAKIGIVAVTDKGARIYFTTRFSEQFTINTGFNAMATEARYVRVLGVASGVGASDVQVQRACYSQGTLVLAVRHSQGHRILMITPRLYELAVCLDLFTRSRKHTPSLREEVTTYEFDSACNILSIAKRERRESYAPEFNPLVTQHLPTPELVFLSSVGTWSLRVARPVEKLRARLLDRSLPESTLGQFFEPDTGIGAAGSSLRTVSYDRLVDPRGQDRGQTMDDEERTSLILSEQVFRREACASALVLAAGIHNPDVGAVQRAAIQLLKRQGGSPLQLNTAPTSSSATSIGVAAGTSFVLHSGLHDAAAQFFSRLVREIWTDRMVISRSNTPALYAKHRLATLEQVSDGIGRLLTAFATICGADLDTVGRYLATGVEDAQGEEVRSLYALYSVMQMANEAIQLWYIFCEEPRRLPDVTAHLTPAERERLKACDFCTFASSEDGEQLAKSMIEKLLAQIGQGSSEGHINHTNMCQRLHDCAPSFFRLDDKLRAEALELLGLAAVGDGNRKLLDEALKIFLDVQRRFETTEELEQLTNKFVAQQAWEQATRLVLGAVRIPRLHARRHAGLKADVQFDASVLQERQRCHAALVHPATGVLSHLYAAIQQAEGEAQARLRAALDKIFRLVLLADDELLEYALFDWLLAKHEDTWLVELESPRVETYLQERRKQLADGGLAVAEQSALRECEELLFRHYRHRQRFADAGRLCARLADADFADLTLEDRHKFLASAIKALEAAHPRTAQISEWLRELLDRREVAQIQVHMCERLRQLPEERALSPDELAQVQADLKTLSTRLFPLEDLYENFAVPHNLHECILAMLHVAGNLQHLEHVWIDVIEDKARIALASVERAQVLQALAYEVARIIEPYHQHGASVPLRTIVRRLEEFAAKLLHDRDLVNDMVVAEALHEVAGLSWAELYEVYAGLCKTQDQYHWIHLGRHLHLLNIICTILHRWREAEQSVPGQRPSGTLRAVLSQDLAGYKVEAKRLESQELMQRLAALEGF